MNLSSKHFKSFIGIFTNDKFSANSVASINLEVRKLSKKLSSINRQWLKALPFFFLKSFKALIRVNEKKAYQI